VSKVILPPIFYNWKTKYSGMGSEKLKRMKEPENFRLNEFLVDDSLDYEIL
jgi:hypothetical protein